MSSKETIEKVRVFNRFYMSSMNLLGNHYLGSEFSITEARILFEIYENEGCNATYIAQIMNIDKSYLSRIIKAHEKRGYISRKTSDTDARSYLLFLTMKGEKRAREFIQESNEEIETVLQGLSDKEEQSLMKAINTIMKLLSKEKGGDLQ